uniref:BED-type domain-containing protein n=1 Tax=Romanomermis culicivorax TaxID=13658 RepID=A0A915J6H0_ROMCU
MAKCLLCKSVYSRGKGTTSKFYTTSTLLSHLKTKHFNQYNDAVQEKQSVAKRKQEQKDLTSLPDLKASNDDKNKPTPSKQLKMKTHYKLLDEDEDDGQCEQSISAVNSVPSSQPSAQPKKLEQTTYQKAKAMVSNYLAKERITSCPLKFWRKNCKNSPELAK